MADRYSVSTTRPIPNLIQGVSQQAAQQRRDPQCEDQFDCVNSVLEGCAARPHGELVKLFAGRDLDGAFFAETTHETENYLTGVSPLGVPFAIDLADGTDCTVSSTAPDYTYLTAGSGDPKDKLSSQAVDDYLFIANKLKTPAMSATTSAAKANEVLVFIRASAFSAKYKVKCSGPGAAEIVVQTGASTVANTQDIAECIVSGTTITGVAIDSGAAINGAGGYVATRTGSLIRITRGDGAAFTVDTEDGNGDDNMVAFNGEASSFARVPARGFTGAKLKVLGDNKATEDDFYIKFDGDPATGVWKETMGYSIKTDLDASTLPHALVNTGYRTFEFRRLTWSTRIAGDDDSAKVPSFIGKKIKSLFYHDRRLGFMWSGGAFLGKSRNPFTLFPDTVQTVLATAPVDATVGGGSDKGPAVLDFAVQVQENLLLWAQGAQFRLESGDQVFKQDTVSAKATTAYEYAVNARPTVVGPFLYLATDVGSYATVRALQFAQGRFQGDVDVSSHVSRYIASGVRRMVASDTLRQLFVQTDGNRQVLYLFNYTFSGQEGFLQTAFNTWRIPGGDILWAGFQSNVLRVLQQRPEGVALLKFDMTPSGVDPQPGATYTTRLDFRVGDGGVTGLAYDAINNRTSFSLPYTPTGPDVKVIVNADGPEYTRGRSFQVISVVGPVVTVLGDLTPYTFYVGQAIRAERGESEFYIRGDNGAEAVDRLVVNRFKVAVANTGYTRIEVSHTVKPTRSYELANRVLGTSSGVTGTPVLRNADLDAPIGEKSDEVRIRLINDSFLPSYWQNAAYDVDAVGWKGAK